MHHERVLDDVVTVQSIASEGPAMSCPGYSLVQGALAGIGSSSNTL